MRFGPETASRAGCSWAGPGTRRAQVDRADDVLARGSTSETESLPELLAYTPSWVFSRYVGWSPVRIARTCSPATTSRRRPRSLVTRSLPPAETTSSGKPPTWAIRVASPVAMSKRASSPLSPVSSPRRVADGDERAPVEGEPGEEARKLRVRRLRVAQVGLLRQRAPSAPSAKRVNPVLVPARDVEPPVGAEDEPEVEPLLLRPDPGVHVHARHEATVVGREHRQSLAVPRIGDDEEPPVGDRTELQGKFATRSHSDRRRCGGRSRPEGPVGGTIVAALPDREAGGGQADGDQASFLIPQGVPGLRAGLC